MTKEGCRLEGKRLFSLFDVCQRRLIEAEVVLGLGRKNAEERARLAATVRALGTWVRQAQELGVAQEFDKYIKLFFDHLRHEARERELAEKTELPWRTRLFLESGTDVTAPTSKPSRQALDFDFDRVLHPRY